MTKLDFLTTSTPTSASPPTRLPLHFCLAASWGMLLLHWGALLTLQPLTAHPEC